MTRDIANIFYLQFHLTQPLSREVVAVSNFCDLQNFNKILHGHSRVGFSLLVDGEHIMFYKFTLIARRKDKTKHR